MHGEAEDHHHHKRRRGKRRADCDVPVKHHEHIEVKHRNHRHDDGHDIADRVSDAAEAVGVDIRHQRESGASVCRHRGESDQEAQYERQEVILAHGCENAHPHESHHGYDGARHYVRFTAPERGRSLVRKPAEKRQQKQSENIVRGNDDAVPDGVQLEHIVVD